MSPETNPLNNITNNAESSPQLTVEQIKRMGEPVNLEGLNLALEGMTNTMAEKTARTRAVR